MKTTIQPTDESFNRGIPPMVLLASKDRCKIALADDVDTVVLSLDLNKVLWLRSLLNSWLANHNNP